MLRTIAGYRSPPTTSPPANLPGKCRGSPPRAPRGWTRFNEAPANLPGKCEVVGGLRYPAIVRFNEAPANLPGKSPKARYEELIDMLASMRPRRICWGNRSMSRSRSSGRSCFNEAPANLLGKCVGTGSRTPRAPSRFNEAPANLLGKYSGTLPRSSWPRRFNEAPANLLGKWSSRASNRRFFGSLQ